jgi:hypothetical protein
VILALNAFCQMAEVWPEGPFFAKLLQEKTNGSLKGI